MFRNLVVSGSHARLEQSGNTCIIDRGLNKNDVIVWLMRSGPGPEQLVTMLKIVAAARVYEPTLQKIRLFISGFAKSSNLCGL
jgi:hypothetical protein